MGAIYTSAYEIPPVGQHEAFALHILDGLALELRENEGALIVGSFANDAWNIRSDIDMFVHTSSVERVSELKSAAADLSRGYLVGLELHCEAVDPAASRRGGYYNHVRWSARQNAQGVELSRGADPNTVLGDTIVPVTPTEAHAFFGRRMSKIQTAIDIGEPPYSRKEAEKGLELPGKIALRATGLQASGFDAGVLDEVMRSEEYQQLLQLDANMTSAVRAARQQEMSPREYEAFAAGMIRPAAGLGWNVLRQATKGLEELIIDSKDTIPANVIYEDFAVAMRGVFDAVHRR